MASVHYKIDDNYCTKGTKEEIDNLMKHIAKYNSSLEHNSSKTFLILFLVFLSLLILEIPITLSLEEYYVCGYLIGLFSVPAITFGVLYCVFAKKRLKYLYELKLLKQKERELRTPVLSKTSSKKENEQLGDKEKELLSCDEACDKLLKLKKLLDEGIITSQEYEEKKKKYIDFI